MSSTGTSKATQMQRATEQYEKRIQSTLGPADYAEARRIRTWIVKHPKRAAILAYLTYK